MPELSKQRQPQKPERSQSPLWFAIAGLVISISSFSMKDMMIATPVEGYLGCCVFWFGAVFAVVSMLYWLFQPKHGLPS